VLRALLAHTTCIVLTTDAACRIRFANRAPAGLSVGQLLGQACQRCVSPVHRPALQQAIDRTQQDGTTTRLELQATGPHGSRAWYAVEVLPLAGRAGDARLVIIAEDITRRRQLEHALQDLATPGPLRDDAGRRGGEVGIVRDVADLLHAEQAQRLALEDSRNLLELALSGSELGTWDADLRTGQVRRDERLLGMLGYGPHELEPTLDAWRRLLHPDDQDAAEAVRRAHIDGVTRIHESEHRLRHKAGHWVWVFEAGKVLRDADGQAVRAIGTTRDISSQKRAAAESVALIRRIEQLIGPLRGDPANGEAQPGGAEVPVPHLTERGREVLGLLAHGLTAAQIAGRLGITRETANTHRRNLMRRLGLRNKAELIRFALEHGIGGPLPGSDP